MLQYMSLSSLVFLLHKFAQHRVLSKFLCPLVLTFFKFNFFFYIITLHNLQNVNESFQSTVMKVFQKKNLYQISGKNIFF